MSIAMDMGFRWLITGTTLIALQRHSIHIEKGKEHKTHSKGMGKK
jgi:hypothetical protein